ncbi:MAG: hypothetical protein A2Y07_11170 [Planctomycetes bacterium GWF2_50_10]|nr:MAG: hypothetical protein A2Y07_11170 [Planctomycetes bacterium GWF2_50_10]
MTWSPSAKWPVKSGDEIQAEHFEDVRKYVWAARHIWLVYGSGKNWTPPTENTWSRTFCQKVSIDYNEFWYGYMVGDVVWYNGEVWVSATNHPAYQDTPGHWVGRNSVPAKDNGGWQLGVDERFYSHYDVNSGRYSCVGDGRANRSLVPASDYLPIQVKPDKQVRGPLKWSYPKLFWEGDTAEFLPGIYKRCLRTHVSDKSQNPANWSMINYNQAQVPIKHNSPVEFAYEHITGVTGAIFPHPLNQGGTPTPWYYSYYMANENQPDNGLDSQKYYNPKVAKAYQAQVELAVDSWGGYWTGPPAGATSGSSYCGHRLGYGPDPSGHYKGQDENHKGNIPFNRSAFEEILHLVGRYDWYLDLSYPPQVNGGWGPTEPGWTREPVACWRRTWKYSIEYPAVIGQTRRIVYLRFSALPADGAQIKVGDYVYKFSGNIWAELEIHPTYAIVPIGWDYMGGDIETACYNLVEAINKSPTNAGAELAGADMVAIYMPVENGNVVCDMRSNASIYKTFLSGGVSLMWPQELGWPPEPVTSWNKIADVEKLIQDLHDRWNKPANDEMRAKMVERHTGNYRAWQDYYHPELVAGILNDMKAAMEHLKYRSENIAASVKSIGWSPDTHENPLMTSFGGAAGAFAGPGEWIEAPGWNYSDVDPYNDGIFTVMPGGYWGSVDPYCFGMSDWGPGIGFRGFIYRIYNPDTGEYPWTPDGGGMGGWSRWCELYGIKVRAVASDDLIARYGQRQIKLKVALYGEEYTGRWYTYIQMWPVQPYNLNPDGTAAGRTICIPTLTVRGGDLSLSQKPNENWIPTEGYITVPLVPYSDNTTAVAIMPDVNFQFYAPDMENLEASANCLCMGVISFGGYDVLIVVDPRELTMK